MKSMLVIENCWTDVIYSFDWYGLSPFTIHTGLSGEDRSAVLPYRKEIVIIMGRDRAIKSSKIVIIGLSRDGMMWASKHNSIYTCTCMEYPTYQGKDTFWVQFSFNDCLSLYFKVYIYIFSPKFYLHLIKTKWRTWAQLLCWPDLCSLGFMGCIVWVYLIDRNFRTGIYTPVAV